MKTNTDNDALHTLRSAQLRALHEDLHESKYIGYLVVDRDQINRYADYSGVHYDTRNLSDKSLEEIDTLASKYWVSGISG